MLSIKCSKSVRICIFIIVGSVITFCVQYLVFQPKLNDNVKTMVKPESNNLDPVIRKSPFIAPPGLVVDEESIKTEGNNSSLTIPITANLNNNSLIGPIGYQQNIAQGLSQIDPRKIAMLRQWAQSLAGAQANMAPRMNPQDHLMNMATNNQGSNGNMPIQIPYQFPPMGANYQAMPQIPYQNVPKAQNPMVNFQQYQGQVPNGYVQYSNANPQLPNNVMQAPIQSVPKQSHTATLFPLQQEALPPEVEGGPDTNILRWNGNGWSKLDHFCAGKLKLNRTMLKSSVGNAIVYIHDLKDDRWVSGSLKNKGMWDKVDVNVMINNLQADPELGFIDIGSHVGTFSLVAARMGRQVVAVDPLVTNVVRFCKAVQANNFTNQITIFYTAISDGYKKVSFQRDIGNIGGTRIVQVPNSADTNNVYDPNFIDTVRLDDLLPHIPFRKAFIKMDVEEHEYEVVTSGTKFFQDIDITGILMEWMWHKNGKNGLKLRDTLLALNFSPYTPDAGVALDVNQFRTWPNDVLWKKMG